MNHFSPQQRVVYTFLGAALVFVFSMLLLVTPTYAASLEIQLGGVDIVFDGTDIDDAGSPVFGTEDPADADPLDTVTFKEDGTPVGTLLGPPLGTDPISVDIHIPGVPPIPVAGGTVTTSGIPPGTFDLLTKAVASAIGLALDLDEVDITYVPISSSMSFVFAGSVAAIDSQDLPFGLEIGSPVTVTLSTQTDSVTTFGGFVESFTASGTGEIRGILVPEPSTLVLAALALLAHGRRRRV
jgi:hypothetical protein